MDEIVGMSRALIERGSKSFAAVARLFPADMRDDAHMLYAWCRHCDDVIDGQELGHHMGAPARSASEMREALERLIAETNAALNGRACAPVFIALSRVVERHRIPHRHPLDLLEGFRMDVEGRSYASIDDTLSYCYHVAGVVGVMMAHVMGSRERATLERAQDLGIAFQLTNICRDIVEDAQQGRNYLPLDWLQAEGLDTSLLAGPAQREKLARLAARLLAVADRYYDSAAVGFSALPFRAAWAVAAASRVYGDIGNLVRERGASAWDERAVVGKQRKIEAVGGALLSALRSRRPSTVSPPRDPALWTKLDLAED